MERADWELAALAFLRKSYLLAELAAMSGRIEAEGRLTEPALVDVVLFWVEAYLLFWTVCIPLGLRDIP